MRVAGYLRVSTQEQVEKGWNLEEDRKLIRQRWRTDEVEFFDDGGRQGDDPDRPGLLALLSRLDEFDVVVMRQQDRISRDPVIWGTAAAAFQKAEVRVETFSGPIDLDTPQGRFFADIMAAVGKLEKGQIAQRVSQAIQARARAGIHVGVAPYGYRWEEGRLVVVPEEAAVVKRIFTEYAEEGRSQREIARRLNRDGIAAQRGTWTQGTVSKLLRNPTCAGRLRFHGDVLDGIHEPIIEPHLWVKAEAMRDANTRTRRGRTPSANHLLAGGVLRCGRCGASMYAQTRPQRGNGVTWEAYTCARRQREGLDSCDQPPVKRQPIDEAVWRFVMDTALDIEATKATIIERANVQLMEVEVLRHQAERDVVKVEQARAKIESDYLYGDLPADRYRMLSERLTAEHEAATANVSALGTRHETLSAELEQIDAETAVLAELSAIKAHILGQAREGERAGVQAFPTAIRRLFTGFELIPRGTFGVGIEGIVCPTQGRSRSIGVDGYLLIPYVRPEALDWEPSRPWAIRRIPLPLRGSDDNTFSM